ncbi:MAG: thiamine phosphate synthase [Bacteroidales bacterium]|nr:thiamine phosphate synthase [Bacteroidales bacterium]
MRLFVVTHPDFIVGEQDKINALFEAGLETLHLRKPDASQKEYTDLLNGIKQEYHCRIKIHSFFELTDNYNLLGVHLNSRNDSYSGKRKVNVSKSCHSIEELEDISAYDYVFLSPVFDSISKEGYFSSFSERILQTASEDGKINEKVIALGGIDRTTLPLLKQYAFGGAAVLGAVWAKEDVVSQFTKLRTI